MDENQEVEKLTGDVETTDDKPMSEEDKEVKGLQKDVNRFHAEQAKATTLAMITNNNVVFAETRALSDLKTAQIKEDKAKKARFQEWANKDVGAIIASRNDKPQTTPPEEKVPA